MKIFSTLVVGLGLMLGLGIGVPVSGQNIDRAEYFFNADPGIGNGTSLSLSPGSQVSLNAEIDALGLSKGFNRLYLRFGNNQGQWGFYEARLFYMDETPPVSGPNRTIIGAEYFIDQDPGIGQGTPLNVEPDGKILAEIPEPNLPKGFHRLYIRYKDSANKWGLFEARLFYLDEIPTASGPDRTLVGAEYFFDQDPGIGQGTPLTVQPDGKILAEIPEPNLTKGFHRLYVRYRDNANKWGLYEARLLYMDEIPPVSGINRTIIGAEYFIDQDPGIGQGTPLTVQPDGKILAEIPEPNLPKGFHRLYIRYRDNANKWGLYEARMFYMDEVPPASGPDRTIVGAEYFFDQDPGVGSGNPLTVLSGGRVIAEIDMVDFPLGFHRMYIRYQDDKGDWGLYENRLFYIDNKVSPAGLILVDRVEYFYDGNDPGQGNAVEVPFLVNTILKLDELVAASGLAVGDHTLHLRIRNTQGNWSDIEVREFTIEPSDDADPPMPELEELPDISALCAVTVDDLIVPTATDAIDGTIQGTTDLGIFPIRAAGTTVITWTFTNSLGISSTQVQNIIITDNEAPLLIAPEDVVVGTGENSCSVTIPFLGNPTVSDNCAVASLTNNAPLVFQLGETLVTWTATDGSGNTSTAIQMVVVEDMIAPTIAAPADVTITLPAGSTEATGVNLGSPAVSDNCSVSSIINDAPDSFPIGTTTVTWTVFDAYNNSASAIQQVTVLVQDLPTITAPADISISADFGECSASEVALGTPTFTGDVTIEDISNDAPAVFPVGNTLVTWTLTDNNGNTVQDTQVVTVTDNEAPIITAPDDVFIELPQSSPDATDVFLGTPWTADNCTIASISNDAPASFPMGTTTVTWTVFDQAGNSSSDVQLVVISYEDQPILVAQADITVNTDEGTCFATNVNLGLPTSNIDILEGQLTNDAPSSYPLGTTVVTWTLTDVNGNTVQDTQTVTVEDNEVPVIVAPANVTVNTDSGNCAATGVALGSPETSDNCSIASVSNNAPASFPLGETVVVWTVTDGSGNTATAEQVVTVEDNEVPVIVAPANVTVNTDSGNCAATGVTLGSPETSDNCSIASVSNNAPASFPLGETVVLWTVTDGSGNTATAEQVVTVEDNEVPVIVAPANVTVSTDSGNCAATGVALGSPDTSDNCSIASVSNNAPASFPLGETVVVWTVTDGSGNMATAEQVVTVEDNEVPVIVAPSNVTVSTDSGNCAATGVALGSPETSDNCSIASVSNDAPAVFEIGETLVTWTVTDGSGNVATATQLVTVVDNELPTIEAPAAVTVNTDSGICTASGVALGTPETSDNCSVASVSNNAPAVFAIGETLVTWTVTDGSGNVATATQLVTVVDNELPAIVAPAAVTVNTDAGLCTASGIALGTPETSDNCSVASVSNNAPAVFGIGETLVIWTVTDGSGNVATATQLVTVVDNELPAIVAPAAVTVNTDAGLCTASGIALGTPETSDNCSVASVSNNAPAVFEIGETLVTWTVTDGSGNVATATQLVTVVDNELPVIVAPSNIVINLPAGATEATGVDLGTPTVSDNCSVASFSNNAPNSFPVGITTVTWTVQDNSGNTASAIQTVTVTADAVQPPVPDLAELSELIQQCSVSFEQLVIPTATDYLGQTIQGTTDTSIFPLVEPGNYQITWTYTDALGNTVTQVQTIVITGNAQNLGNVDCGFNVNDLVRFDVNTGASINALGSSGWIDNQGRIYIGGSFNRKGETVVGNIVRYLPDGTFDPGFSASTNSQVYVMSQQTDGKLLLGGNFTEVNGQPMNRFVRLLESGEIDPSFNLGQGFDSDLVRNIAVQPDGKIILLGGFNSYKGQAVNKILRLEPNGEIDNSFNPQIPFFGFPVPLALQQDGKIVFSARDVDDFGVPAKLIRLNPNGSIDFSLFTPIGGTIWDIAVQDDGKLVIVGAQSFNGTPINGIGRINRDGTLDTSFQSGTGFGPGLIRTVYSRKDRGMFVGGAFTSYQGQSAPGIVAINPDGSIDSRYNFGTGGNAVSPNVQKILQQADGKLIVIGWFDKFDGEVRTGAVRLFAELGERPPLADFEEDIFPIFGNNPKGLNWVDYDNDGDLDFLVVSLDGSQLYVNDGEGNFSPIDLNIPGMGAFKAVWGDMDGDGDLDLFLNGNSGGENISRIYENRGQEGFVDINAGIIGLRNAEAAWGDYDNDGDLDLIIVGDIQSGNTFEAYTRIYRNDGNGVFTDINAEIAQLHVGAVTWVDFDNDGDLDILVSGNTSSNAGGIPTTKIYRNDGNDVFTDIQINIPGLFEPAADWGDYDNDGDLDLLLTGRRADSSAFSMLYRNDGNEVFTPISTNIRPNWAGSVQWGDYDNDGKLDLYISGINFGLPWGDPNSFIGRVYRNLGNDQFEELTIEGLPGTYFNTGGWGDYDNDGDLDLMITGINSSFRFVTHIFKNNHVEKGGNANTLPSAPGNLVSSVDFETQQVSLSWAAASDAETPDPSLSYNVYIREVGSNSFANSPESDVSNGWRKLPQIGNVMLNRSFEWNFAAEDLGKDYEWSVQAIDQAYAGSQFATLGAFSLDITPPCQVVALANDLTVALDRNGLASITTRQANDGSFSECTGGNPTITLSQSTFTCADLGTNEVTLTATDRDGNVGTTVFTVTVVDNLAPTISKTPRSIKVSIAPNTGYTLPDFRLQYPASDNCTVVSYLQSPLPGTVYTAAGVYPVTLTATDQIGNQTIATINIELSVTQPRGGGRNNAIDMGTVLRLPWNTPFSELEDMEVLLSDEAGEEKSYRVVWNEEDYDPLTPGLYQIRGTAMENISFNLRLREEEPLMNVLVEDKPMATDIELDSNIIPRNIAKGQVIGRLSTIDPVDDIHSYSLDFHPAISLVGNEILWNREEKPEAVLNITVHSTDRAGQTISREIKLQRELAPNDVLVYPNPAIHQSNILVELAQASDVTIRIFDGAGKLVMEEQGYHQESFVRNLDLKGLSSGMYHILVQIDHQVISRRLVKE